MRRKSFLWAIAIVGLLAGGAGTVLAVLVRHVPDFYARAALPPGDMRQRASGEFVSKFIHLIDGVANQRQWGEPFTQEQINSYFEEDFVHEHGAERPLPEYIHEPRVVIEPDRIRLGFRYGKGLGSTIISIDLRAWLMLREPNVVAIEFQAVHAGALLVSAQSMLERVADLAEQHDMDPIWYRLNGHPVLVLRFQAERSTPTFRLQRLELQDGKLLVAGKSNDSTPPAAVSRSPGEPPPN
jgi:hypothetical protein